VLLAFDFLCEQAHSISGLRSVRQRQASTALDAIAVHSMLTGAVLPQSVITRDIWWCWCTRLSRGLRRTASWWYIVKLAPLTTKRHNTPLPSCGTVWWNSDNTVKRL